MDSPTEHHIAAAESRKHYELARTLFKEYGESLSVDLCFQGFEAELAQIDTMYGPPAGRLFLAWSNAQAIGCIAVRPLNTHEVTHGCEMKRLYVRDSARGTGLGRALACQAIAWAKAHGYRRMCLDTLVSMDAARALYRALGFREIQPYYHTPLAGTTFMALDL